MLTAASGIDRTCVPFARGDRWRKRRVITDRCRCSVRRCGSWSDVLNDKCRCSTHCMHFKRRRNVPIDRCSAAYTTGAGGIYTHRQMRVLRTQLAQARCTQRQVQVLCTQLAQCNPMTGASAAYPTGAGGTNTHRQVRVQHPLKAQAQCAHPRAQEQRRTLWGWCYVLHDGRKNCVVDLFW